MMGPPMLPSFRTSKAAKWAVSSTVNPIIIHKRKGQTEAGCLRPASPLTLTQVTCQLFWARAWPRPLGAVTHCWEWVMDSLHE